MKVTHPPLPPVVGTNQAANARIQAGNKSGQGTTVTTPTQGSDPAVDVQLSDAAQSTLGSGHGPAGTTSSHGGPSQMARDAGYAPGGETSFGQYVSQYARFGGLQSTQDTPDDGVIGDPTGDTPLDGVTEPTDGTITEPVADGTGDTTPTESDTAPTEPVADGTGEGTTSDGSVVIEEPEIVLEDNTPPTEDTSTTTEETGGSTVEESTDPITERLTIDGTASIESALLEELADATEESAL